MPPAGDSKERVTQIMTVNNMNTFHSLATAAALLASFALSTTNLAQGSLTPPPGPITPVMKSLDQLEPRTPLSEGTTPGGDDGTFRGVFRINAPGSYYLTTNLTVATGFDGIEVNSDGVTIDLAGFTITGQTGSRVGIRGKGNPRRGLVVRNGGLRGLGTHGIENFSNARDNRFEDLVISGCGGSGIFAGNALVRNCAVSQCTNLGIFLQGQAGSLVEGCAASGNSDGIIVANGIISRCSAVGNTDIGLSVGNSGSIRDCHVEGSVIGVNGANLSVTGCTIRNCSTGISVNISCQLTGNLIVADTLRAGSTGISFGFSGHRVEQNTIFRMATGIRGTGAGSLIVGNSFRDTTSALNVVAGNRVGALLTGASSGAINGNTGGGLGTTDPNANLIY